MKTNFLKFIAIMLIFAGSFSACSKISELKNDSQVVNEPNLLANTKWKLVGIVDVETGKFTELEPKDHKNVYTLMFHPNDSISGLTTCRPVYGTYSRFSFIIRLNIIPFRIKEGGDGDLYVKTFETLSTFSRQGNELKLYYNDNKNYLLYKLIGGTNHEN